MFRVRKKVTRMGGPGSGRKKGSKNRPGTRTMSQIAGDPKNVDPTINHVAIVFGKALMGLEPVDLSDADAMEARWLEFLDLCDEHEIRPMVTGMAMAFGIPNGFFRQVVYGYGHHANYRGVTPESRSVLKKGYEFIQMYLELSMQSDIHNPAKYIFLMKNYFGYQDQTVQIHVDAHEGMALQSADDVAEKYKALVGRPAGIPVEAIVEGDADTGEAEAPRLPPTPEDGDARSDPPGDPR